MFEVHKIFYRNYFSDLFDIFELEINYNDFSHSKEKILKLPIEKQEYFREKYGNLAYYRNDLIPYFLSYLLDEYPENYYTDRIISNLDKYLDSKVWDNHFGFPLIDEETLKLAKEYQNLANDFRINGDFRNDSSIKGNYKISLGYDPIKLDLSKDDSKNKRKYLINGIKKIDSNSVKTDYYKKYLKYKNKYLTLRKQFCGTKTN